MITKNKINEYLVPRASHDKYIGKGKKEIWSNEAKISI
jgi:hypothetical protein